MNAKVEVLVQVRVVTTSGSYPDHGYDRAPVHQPVKVELAEAVRKLRIRDTNGWVALVNGTEIDVEKSYDANGLKGEIVIDFGPKEGGGGRE